jgi:hypothetical protein
VGCHYPKIFNIKAKPINAPQEQFVNISFSIFSIYGNINVNLNIIYPDATLENFPITSNKIEDTYYLNQTYNLIGNYRYFIVVTDKLDNTHVSSNHTFSII